MKAFKGAAMASFHLVFVAVLASLCSTWSSAEVRYGGNAVAARAAARQGGGAERGAQGGLAGQAVHVSAAAMTAGGRAASPTSPMRAFGGGHAPAAWRGISRAADEGEVGLPPARYGFYPPSSQPPHDTRKAVGYAAVPAAQPSYEPPAAMIDDEARAALIPPPAPAQQGFGVGHDRVILNGPIGEAGQGGANGGAAAGNAGGGSLYNIFMGGGQ